MRRNSGFGLSGLRSAHFDSIGALARYGPPGPPDFRVYEVPPWSARLAVFFPREFSLGGHVQFRFVEVGIEESWIAAAVGRLLRVEALFDIGSACHTTARGAEPRPACKGQTYFFAGEVLRFETGLQIPHGDRTDRTGSKRVLYCCQMATELLPVRSRQSN